MRPVAARGSRLRDKRPHVTAWPPRITIVEAEIMAERIMLWLVFAMLAIFFFAMIVVPHVPFLAGAE
jgi:hypothetical protein